MPVPTEALAPVTLSRAAEMIASGEVIAHPTEAVYGLGCDPDCEAAVHRICQLKNRPLEKGLIVIARSAEELDGWVAWDDVIRSRVTRTWPGPVTWIVPARPEAPQWLVRDGHLAVRVTAHPDTRRLLEAWGRPLVSTSANPAGQPPARTHRQLARYFAGLVALAPGRVGTQSRPSEIRHARTGEVLRAG